MDAGFFVDRLRPCRWITGIRVGLLLLLGLLSCSVCHADDLWVAVGYGGRRMMSTDGRTWKITGEWTQPGGDDSNNLMGLIYANEKFVAVGGGGWGKNRAGHVLVSKNGEDWREVWAATNRISPVVYGNDRFLVGGPERQIYWSSDAERWNPGVKLPDKRCTHFRKGAFGNGVFVITGNNGGKKPSWIIVTKDGKTVDNVVFDIPNIRDMSFADGKFVVVGRGVRIVSTDGVTWQSTDLPKGEKLTWVIHIGDEFLCGGAKRVFASKDGVDWTVDSRKIRGLPKWTDGKRIISTVWPGKMFLSEDAGKTWRPGNRLTANGINRVVKANAQ